MADLTLKNKTALITGASGAIGEAIANKFSSLGANVILTDKIKKKIDDLEKKLGPNSLGLIADLSKDEEIHNLYNESIKKFKSIDILVNNAGINRDALSIRMTKEQWHEVININLSAAFKLSQLVIKSMIKQKWGRILNCSSIGVKFGGGTNSYNYSLAKHCLEFIPNSYKNWAKRNVFINNLRIGVTNTKIHKRMKKNLNINQRLKLIPINRMAEPKEISTYILNLSTENNSYMTGQTITVSGGE